MSYLSLIHIYGVEAGGTIKGMGLLPMDTVFARKKTRTRVEGSFGQLTGAFAKLSDTALEGYEIHMGETALKGDAKPSTSIQDSVKMCIRDSIETGQ